MNCKKGYYAICLVDCIILCGFSIFFPPIWEEPSMTKIGQSVCILIVALLHGQRIPDHIGSSKLIVLVAIIFGATLNLLWRKIGIVSYLIEIVSMAIMIGIGYLLKNITKRKN